ncbi:MAG: NAD(P)H-binding protein [Planctomycetota bacterium]
MKVAITGGNGFVGVEAAKLLREQGHEPIQLSRRNNGDVGDVSALRGGFAGCEAVVHAAGINREIGDQTYIRVHIDGTRNVVQAARDCGVRHVTLVSFLRARPYCGSDYHESKFASEQIVRNSGLDYTVLKPGVIYGRGDHMLDHLKRAFLTFPVFAFVGLKDQDVAPIHGTDMARILASSITDARLMNGTFYVIGPETMTLPEAVMRVAKAVNRSPITFRMPIWFHRLFAFVAERVMRVPVVAAAQVRILSEGVAEPAGGGEALPEDLLPTIPFADRSIREGLPDAGRYTLRDLRFPGFSG